MTYFAASSAPPRRRIQIEYGCPIGYDRKSDLLGTQQKKEELCQIADRFVNSASIGGVKVQAVLDGFLINFVKGSVTIEAVIIESVTINNAVTIRPGQPISSELDVLSTKYIKENQEYIATINPQLAEDLKGTPGREEAEKITTIFYELFDKYEKEQRYNPHFESEPLFRSTVGSMVPGFKEERKMERVEAMSLSYLKEKGGRRFKKFIETLPNSLLSNQKTIPFLQKGLDLKTSKADKILYLKQMLFLITFKEVLTNTLQDMLIDLSISKNKRYNSSDWEDRSEETYQIKNRQIQATLSTLSVNKDILLLIPLACRASLEELESNPPNYPFPSKDYVEKERNKAQAADIALRSVLKDSFESFFVLEANMNQTDLLSIDQFLMGVSGLAISSGSSGRFPMYEHRTIYYSRSNITVLKPASDNMAVEFLMTAAQFYPESKDTWVEERCLPYLSELIGGVAPHDLDTIKAKFHQVRQAIHKAHVEILMKEKPRNRYVLRDSVLQKLHSLYEKVRHEVGLVPRVSALPSRFKKLAL